MTTNILATILIAVVTNTYAPKQYDCSYEGMSMPPVHVEKWCDEPGGLPSGIFGWPARRTRDNPDVRITEIHEVKTLSFECEGKTWSATISDKLISTTKKVRRVTTTEEWEDAP